MSRKSFLVSPQNDNVLFVPDRNVLLTGARWGFGNGPTPDDAERARPAGSAEESQEEADHAKGSGGRDRSERAASAAYAAGVEAAWRPSGSACGARPALEPEDCRRGGVPSDRHPQPGCVSRIWTDFGGRVLGEEARHRCEPGNRARLDDRRQTVASEGQARGQSAYLACTPQPLRRTSAMGHQRARLAGRPWSEAVLDQHDRRRHQPGC